MGVRSAFAFFSVQNKPKKVTLQRANMSKQDKSLWIPFDIRKWEIGRLESSAEESAVTYKRNIYEFMSDEPSDAIDSLNIKTLKYNRHKNSYKFVEEMQPISLPLVSYSSSSSVCLSLYSVNMFLLFLAIFKVR